MMSAAPAECWNIKSDIVERTRVWTASTSVYSEVLLLVK